MKPIIRVEGLSKQYRIGAKQPSYATLRESLTNIATAPFRRLRNTDHRSPTTDHLDTIWALKDVSFEVQPGEVVGIIGRNGAGKSTLLKILSRITEPTAGRVDLYGRVGSLLEVGTGFHAELTGRENIYLNGAILGMKKSEIDRRFDEIVDFAEIEKFLDTPVKHYSSGMYMRLAFSVAAHLEPEILIIDEVLAVGDFAFQQKCLQKAGKVASDGKTVLIVSHNLAVLGEIASTAIWIEKGQVREWGALQIVTRSYSSSGTLNSGTWESEASPEGTQAFVTSVQVVQENSTMIERIMVDHPFFIELRYTITKKMPFCRVGILISNSLGVMILSTAEPDDHSLSPLEREPGTYTTKCIFPAWLLAPDTYFITPHIDDAPLRRHFTVEQACSFVVVENTQRGVSHYYRPGVIAPKLPWAVTANCSN